MVKYDFLIIGSGLYGATISYMLTKYGYSCLVIDKRPHIGGNAYTENIEGINVHKYGPHIFHTNSRKIWNFVNSFVEFNRYTNSPVANYKGRLYNLPFNMNTFYQMWGVKTPSEAKKIIEQQRKEAGITNPKNLEEQAIALVGKDIYYTLIKEYTEKQWGRKAKELPSSIIKRLPIRFTFNNNYFDDSYQGIPIGGYTQIFKKMLDKSEILLNTDYFCNRDYFDHISKRIIYTGEIDKFFNYRYGYLEYRSIDFQTEILNKISNYQGNAVMNFIDSNIIYTRIIEHKHFEFGIQQGTVITREYPKEWSIGNEPLYPINNVTNCKKYNKYHTLANQQKKIIFGGRLAEYKYLNMDEVIGRAINMAYALSEK